LEGVIIANQEEDSPKKKIQKEKSLHQGNVINQGRDRNKPWKNAGQSSTSYTAKNNPKVKAAERAR